MPKKRIRIFAGPNGSGKTTIINEIKSIVNLGVYVNADDIEKEILENNFLNLEKYQIEINNNKINLHFKASKLSPLFHKNINYDNQITILNKKLIFNQSIIIDSYLAADIAELIRICLLEEGKNFTYETVMSHPNKIEFLREAKEKGYKIYLYYISTEDPLININRVIDVRVAQNGHFVDKEKIISRYYKSLENLKPALKLSDRAYLFDNSQKASLLIAEVTNGVDVKVIDTEKVPNWFVNYVVS